LWLVCTCMLDQMQCLVCVEKQTAVTSFESR